MKNCKKIASLTMASVMALGTVQMAFADTYTVKKGDCLAKIAPKYNTTWQNLAEMNKLENPRLIQIGQVLQVPDVASTTVKPAETIKPAEPVKPVEPAKPVEPTKPVEPAKPETTEKVEEAISLTGLSIFTAVQDGKDIEFKPETTEYSFDVQSDCYGVKVKATAPEGATVTINGEEAVSGEAKVVKINGDYENYDKVLETPIEIVVTKGDASKTYTINVVRECDKDVYALFQQLEYVDEATGEKIPYNLYVPSNYDKTKKYPIVFALHGSGQRNQSVDMVLKRYQMATVWAKDSEAGHNQCIVLAPQCATADENENWTTLMQYRNKKHDNAFDAMPKLTASYNLLQKVMKDYSVDANRVYMTGLSAGGFGTYTLAIEHPETFAAIAPDAAGADPEKVKAIKDIPMWIFHAADDPTVKPDEYLYPTLKALDEAGAKYKSTIYEAGTVFGSSAHFSWVPMYANKEFRDWLFEQHK